MIVENKFVVAIFERFFKIKDKFDIREEEQNVSKRMEKGIFKNHFQILKNYPLHLQTMRT